MINIIQIVLLSWLCAADFDWGTATAAYQVEGYITADGRTPSIWDTFSDPQKGHIANGASGEPADEDYVRYQQTIQLLTGLGVKNYRFSLSWTRIIQQQTVNNPAGKVNMPGVQHYINFFEALTSAGISPTVTLWHWDTPDDIETMYGGFLNPGLLPMFFEEYAKVVFKYFGKYTKYFASLNEPYTLFSNGYMNTGAHAPGRCSDRSHCENGDDTTEPYKVLYTQILAHAYAFRAFNNAKQAGDVRSDAVLGIVLNCDWAEPASNSQEDILAAERFLEYQAAMYFDPIFTGEYPQSLIDGVGARLPRFDDEQKALIKGAHNGVYFMNFYTGQFVWNNEEQNGCGYNCDARIHHGSISPSGAVIGYPCKANTWLYRVPYGLRNMLKWVHNRYDGIEIRITENGWGDPDTDELNDMLNDSDRCEYYREYIGNMSLAHHEDGVNLKGYFAWSLMDNFEWADGYTTRFGLTYVNYTTQERIPKQSYYWFQQVARLKELPQDGVLPACQQFEVAREEK